MLSLSYGMPNTLLNSTLLVANASLFSHRSISSTVRFCLASSLRTAGMGASAKRQLSTADHELPTSFASGVSRCFSTASAEASRRLAAPSLIWLAFPAVRIPSGEKAGRSPASASAEMSARIPSSFSMVTVPLRVLTSNGVISLAKTPLSVASAARLWE